nr:isochorismate synthase [Stenotrophomonas maltophilia]
MRAPELDLQKVVLARSLVARTHRALSPDVLLARLGADPSVATYAVPLPVEVGQVPAWLVGATPELLLRKRGAELLSHPLAGSARRCADAAEDERAAQDLLASTKDHDEHRHVVEAIVEGLAPYCSHIDAQPRPALHATASMWHLGTRIHATLKDPHTSAAELLAQLHPTPAVCGTPRLAALQRIRELETVPRGFYAGAVGWLDAQGDGDWYVAIRCARLQGMQLRLFAGAGIVADSQPEAEVAETAAKFAALLNALGVHESAPAIEPAA